MFHHRMSGLLPAVGLAINAQTINLRGTVTNKGGDPIDNTIVALSVQPLVDTTDSAGRYTITGGEASVRQTSLP